MNTRGPIKPKNSPLQTKNARERPGRQKQNAQKYRQEKKNFQKDGEKAIGLDGGGKEPRGFPKKRGLVGMPGQWGLWTVLTEKNRCRWKGESKTGGGGKGHGNKT